MSRCTRGRWKTRTGGETRPRRRQRSHGRATAALQPTTGATWATCWRRTWRTPRTCCTICSTISTGSGPGDLTDHGDRQRSAAARSAPAPRSDRRCDQHRGATTAAAYPPGQRPRRSDPRPAARSAPAPAIRSILSESTGGRVVSWTPRRSDQPRRVLPPGQGYVR